MNNQDTSDRDRVGAVTSRQVTRWYFDGKGYSNKMLAYKKMAYKLLLDELLGDVGVTQELGQNAYGDEGTYEVKLPREKLRDLSDKEIKNFIHDAFLEKFPHETSLRCDTVCAKRYLGDGETEDGYVYDTCKAAQDYSAY